MKITHLVLTALIKVGLQVLAIVQIASAIPYSALVGTTAATILVSHGITQPVFGAISLLASVPFEVKIIKHYVKPTVQEVPKKITAMLDRITAMEKKYGNDWMDRVSAVADTVAKLDKKK